MTIVTKRPLRYREFVIPSGTVFEDADIMPADEARGHGHEVAYVTYEGRSVGLCADSDYKEVSK